MKDKRPNKDRILVLPSQAELNRLLMYNQVSGHLFWRERPRSDFQTKKAHATWNAKYAGKPALSSVHKSGYLCGHLFGVPVRAHRVIWKLMTGTEAEVVDHDDGDRSNNAWTNLKSGSDAENMKNKKLYSSNKSGVIGVYWHTSNQKWHASIRQGGVRKNLGFFSTLEEASEARATAEAELGFNPNHGRKAVEIGG